MVMLDPGQQRSSSSQQQGQRRGATTLFWLVVDIPADALTTGALDQDDHGVHTIARYVAPVVPPSSPVDEQCLFTVFMLFRQPRSLSGMVKLADLYEPGVHPLRARDCLGLCEERQVFFCLYYMFYILNYFGSCHSLFTKLKKINNHF